MNDGRILVVDDDQNLRRVTQVQLEDEGYTVTTAANADDALRVLARTPQDLVITDLSMTGMSGVDLLRTIRSEYPETGVVLIRAFGTVESAVDAMRLGAIDYITKFSRFEPSAGAPPGSREYLGKMVPEIRKAGLPPVPVITPDGSDLPWKMVGAVKEFHLVCEPVTKEFLPGYPMKLYGYNGSMPGPTIQAFQGDRVRLPLRWSAARRAVTHSDHGL